MLIDSSEVTTLELLRQALKLTAPVSTPGITESNTINVSLLEMSFSRNSNEPLFRSLLQNSLENSSFSTLAEFTFQKKKHGLSSDFLDLSYVKAADLIVRRPKGGGFDEDALMYIEFKARAYGDFGEKGKIEWVHAEQIWADTFMKLNEYKNIHKRTDCYFALIAYGIDRSKSTGIPHTYENKADLENRKHFEDFCNAYAEKMGLIQEFSTQILPKEGSSRDWLALDVAIFSIKYIEEDRQDKILQSLFKNNSKEISAFKKKRADYKLSLMTLYAENFQ